MCQKSHFWHTLFFRVCASGRLSGEAGTGEVGGCGRSCTHLLYLHHLPHLTHLPNLPFPSWRHQPAFLSSAIILVSSPLRAEMTAWQEKRGKTNNNSYARLIVSCLKLIKHSFFDVWKRAKKNWLSHDNQSFINLNNLIPWKTRCKCRHIFSYYQMYRFFLIIFCI